MPRKADPPDIELGASFRAKTLRFEEVPETDVRHVGDSSSVQERKNLPDEVEAGVTYHDVEVRWHSEVRTTEGGRDDEAG